MNGTVVEWVVASAHSQESRTLLKCFGAHTRHFHQLATVAERTVFRTEIYDVLGKLWPKSAHVGQQMLGCGVHIHTHFVHTRYHGLVKAFLQLCLVHVFLVLSHTDTAWVNLHQLCQRVHQPAAYRHSSAHGHVVVGKFLTCHFRSAVDGCAVFTHHIDFYGFRQAQSAHKVLRLSACCAVADGDGLNLVLFGQCPDFVGCGLAVAHTSAVPRCMGINGLIVEQIAFRVQTDGLAASAEACVNSQHTFLA